ncbi:hypothetical protein PR048_023440 [Dryococelus australis]|uniref:Uncharacterized protein n=1 Tax=Dryococelus australis TaxID=614101 RepID=A0ABQ9GU27_9NEOP|nr:hypothetical protein PR048_023440 [Dryococelus australis]
MLLQDQTANIPGPSTTVVAMPEKHAESRTMSQNYVVSPEHAPETSGLTADIPGPSTTVKAMPEKHIDERTMSKNYVVCREQIVHCRKQSRRRQEEPMDEREGNQEF